MNSEPRCLYVVGDWASLERWDRTERKENMLGSPGRVLAIRKETHCESGFMITVQGYNNGKILELDHNWLEPYRQPELFEI